MAANLIENELLLPGINGWQPLVFFPLLTR